MFVQVAHYTLGRGSVDELRARVEQGPAKVMAESPGFVSYQAFDAGDGLVASVAVFQTEQQMRDVEEKLEAWIGETIEAFDITPGHMSEGPVFADAG